MKPKPTWENQSLEGFAVRCTDGRLYFKPNNPDTIETRIK
jgi:hypothetical protein